MQIPAEGELPYFTLYSQIPFEDDVFAEAIEMLPSNSGVVHHMSVNVTTLPEGTVSIDGQPYADDWAIMMQTDVSEPITFYAILPHRHLRGKDMRFRLIWPDGRDEILLDVPRYDFNWQTEFELVEPLRIPAGSQLIVEGHHDNSLNNRYNPAPDKEVYWGAQSWDEMFEGWVKYSIDSQDISGNAPTQ